MGTCGPACWETKYLLPLLTEYGHGDLAYRVATQTDYPSWGRWFASAEGSTTMWEAWDDYRSRNHFFLGTIDDWFYEDLVGITPAAPGYREISIAPQVVGELTRASGSTRTPLGVVSSWRQDGEVFTLDVDVPVGATAVVSVPVPEGKQVSVDGRLVADAPGVEEVGVRDGRVRELVRAGGRLIRPLDRGELAQHVSSEGTLTAPSRAHLQMPMLQLCVGGSHDPSTEGTSYRR